MAKTREDVLTDAAIKFAQAYWDRVANRRDENGNPTAPMVPAEKQAFAKGEDAYVDWMAQAMYAKMAADPEYSAENWNEAKAERLEKFDDYKGALYAIQGGPSPEAEDEQKMFATFYPYIKDGAWYNMSPKAITALMNSPEFGYDSSNEKSRQQFWDDLTKYDLLYQRGKIVNEFANSGWGKMNAVLNRTAYKEAMEQALGDKPYDEGAVWTGFGIDRARDAMMGPALGLGGVVKPALAMGAADAASQYMAAAGLGQTEYSPEETLSSMGAGATVVPGFRYGTRWLSRVKNPAVAKFGVEMNRGARNYAERDYVAEEANALKQQLLQARKNQKVFRNELPGSPKYDAAQEAETALEDKLRLLGFSGDLKTADPARAYEEMSGRAFNNAAEGRVYSIDQVLGRQHPRPITDEQAVANVLDAYGNPETFNVNRPTLEQAAHRLAGRNLGYSNDKMDKYQIVKQFEDMGYGDGMSIPAGMKTAVENEAARLIENGEAANYLDQVLRGATERRSGLEGAFPRVSEKYRNAGMKPKGRTPGSVTGSTVSNALGLLSGSEGVDLVSAVRAAGTIRDDRSVFQDKIDAFKQSDWYRNLPEDRKNVIEAAFKEAAEERKKKGK